MKPGSREAMTAGCLCPYLDNEMGLGYLGDGEKFGWIINADCPIHGTNKEQTMEDIGVKLAKARMKRQHTLQEAADFLEIYSASTLSKIERNAYTNDIPEVKFKKLQDYIECSCIGKVANKIPKTAVDPFTEYAAKGIEYHRNKPALIKRIKVYLNGNLKTIGYLVADAVDVGKYENGFVSIGISLCHPKDTFNKLRGRQLAFDRLEKYDTPYKIVDRCGCVEEEYSMFVYRVEKYFNNRNVILPRVEFITYKH